MSVSDARIAKAHRRTSRDRRTIWTRLDDRDAEVPIGVQLAWALQISDRRWAPRAGQRLPGLRELAEAVGVNVNTVRAVYQRLEQEGLIDSRQGTGTFVAATPSDAPLGGRRSPPSAAREALETGVDPREVAAALYVCTPMASRTGRRRASRSGRRAAARADRRPRAHARRDAKPPPRRLDRPPVRAARACGPRAAQRARSWSRSAASSCAASRLAQALTGGAARRARCRGDLDRTDAATTARRPRRTVKRTDGQRRSRLSGDQPRRVRAARPAPAAHLSSQPAAQRPVPTARARLRTRARLRARLAATVSLATP